MGDKIAVCIKKLKGLNSDFNSEFGKLAEEDLKWKPGTNQWSIAQVIEHLITTNQSYFSIFDHLKSGTYKTSFVGKIPFMASFFGNLILKSVEPSRKKKMKTLAIWEPSYSNTSPDIIEQFNSHQHRLINEVDSLKELLDKNIVINSPANRLIVYTLDKAIEIIVVHEERHLNQAREILIMKSSWRPF